MKRKIYKLLSGAKQGSFALALTLFSGAAYSQTTYTMNYTGAVQTLNLQAGSYDIEMWGADGGGTTGTNVNANVAKLGGKGGYTKGTLTVAAATTASIYVGGKGNTEGVNVAGGFNGGGNSGAGALVSGVCGSGGGASDIRIGGNAFTDRKIVAGGGGAAGYQECNGAAGAIAGGNGGGTTGGATPPFTYANRIGQGGTQTAGGAGGTDATYVTGNAGSFGLGANGGTASVASGNGAGGGGGWYGGGSGANGFYCAGGGGGGSSYIGGVTNGATIMYGQTGFVPNPVITGNGIVIIKELCSISLVATGVNANGAICTGATVSLTTNAVSGYTWNTGASTSSLVISPTITTSYTLTAMSPSNCVSSAVITITVDSAPPTLTVVNTANAGGICPTKTVALTASGATTYTWTGGATTVTNGVAFAPPTATNYTVTGTNACGSNSAATSVSVHPLPVVIAVASSASLCSGSTLTLNTTGSNASTYTWTTGQTSGTGFTPALTATYTVIGTSALSCTASAAVGVTVVATPVLAPTSSSLINCIGNSVTLTATGATNYTWTSATQTVFTATLAATPSATGVSTYTVIKANSNCVDTKIISITTNSLPTIFAIVNPTLVCALSPATLAVGGGVSYTWTAPGTPTTSFNGAAPVVYPLAPSVYTVAASDGTCINRTTVSLAVNPNPTISVSSQTAICDGQSVTVNALGGINYTWTSTSGGTFQNTLTITDTPTTTVAYNIIGDNSFNCTSTAMQVVIVNPNPTVTISSTRTLVCSASPATLTANGAANYTWTSNSATTNTTLVNPVSLTSAPVIYTAVGAYTTGCVGSKTFAVNVYVPILTVSGNTNTCIGGMLSLSAGGGNNGTYVWNTGTSTSNFQNLTTTLSAAGVFTLSASSTSITTNCPATKTVGVGTYFNPTITAVAQRTTICAKESTQLYGDGGVSYTWNTSAQGGTITVNPITQTNYTVTGTDANGCVSTGTVQVKVSGCVGIDELSDLSTSLLVYPNPNNGAFTFKSTSEVKLTLVNELGQIINTYTLSAENNYKASVNDLTKGIYFISGQGNTAQINKKIIVTR